MRARRWVTILVDRIWPHQINEDFRTLCRSLPQQLGAHMRVFSHFQLARKHIRPVTGQTVRTVTSAWMKNLTEKGEVQSEL
jgi:hypothetical protein